MRHCFYFFLSCFLSIGAFAEEGSNLPLALEESLPQEPTEACGCNVD